MPLSRVSTFGAPRPAESARVVSCPPGGTRRDALEHSGSGSPSRGRGPAGARGRGAGAPPRSSKAAARPAGPAGAGRERRSRRSRRRCATCGLGVVRGEVWGREARSGKPSSAAASNRASPLYAVWREIPSEAAAWATGQPRASTRCTSVAAKRGQARVPTGHGSLPGRHRSSSHTTRDRQSRVNNLSGHYN